MARREAQPFRQVPSCATQLPRRARSDNSKEYRKVNKPTWIGITRTVPAGDQFLPASNGLDSEAHDRNGVRSDQK